MAAFEYAALNGRGRRQRGVVEGDSSRHVRQLLRDRGLTPLEVTATQRRAEQSDGNRGWVLWWRRISALDLALFTRQLATLIGAGLPVEEALGAVAQQSERRKASAIFMTVRSGVMQGQSLANALAEFPQVFSRMYRSTVAAGEQSGFLDVVLANLAAYLEDRFEARRNIEMALYYPIILFLSAIAIVGALMTYVIPKIVVVFENSGTQLPRLTEWLIATSEFLQGYGLYLILVMLLSTVAMHYVLRLTRPRLVWDRVKLLLPLFGWLGRSSNAARFASTLAILGKSGVPIVDGMRIAAEVVVNHSIKARLQGAVTNVEEGGTLRDALQSTGHFPPIFLHMVGSGETSGTLDEMLSKAAEFQQHELERVVETMVQLFRPLTLLVMAVLVLAIMLAILLPILNINQLVL